MVRSAAVLPRKTLVTAAAASTNCAPTRAQPGEGQAAPGGITTG
ncbi:hypothetical protein [Bradyrhizobium sp. WD16]|nr:hypothetical protein [Bradyrhizobium sp. WD16]